MRGNSAFYRAVGHIRQGHGPADRAAARWLLAAIDPHVQHLRRHRVTLRTGRGQTTSNYGLDARQAYDDLNGFLHRAGELAEELLAEGITAMKIWPFDHAAEKTRGLHISAADLKAALEPFEKIRKAVGDQVDIMVEFELYVAAPTGDQHR